MRRIYKWPLDVTTQVPWTPGDRVLLVAHQAGDLPTLWAEQEDESPAIQSRTFVVAGTVHPAPLGCEHVGSAVCGAFVWHVYAERVS